MDINQLKCFISVADNKSFSRAALMLNWSQPAVSKQIKELETELRVQLFSRTTRSVNLTSDGKYFYGVAINVVRTVKVATENLTNTDSSIFKNLTIGYLNTNADRLFMPILIRELNERYQNPTIHVTEAFFNTLATALEHGNLSFAFCERDNILHHANLGFLPLRESGYVLACPKHSEFSDKTMVNISDLVGHKIIFGDIKSYLPTEQKLHDKIIEKVGTYNIDYAEDMMIMQIFVRSENRFGMIPEYGIDPSITDIDYIPINDDVKTTFGMAYSKDQNKGEIQKLTGIVAGAYRMFLKQWCN